MALGVLIGLPFELSRRLKTALQIRRNLPADHPEFPLPRGWTAQHDLSTHCTWRALEKDLWANRRESLSQDVWHNDRHVIDTPSFRRMPKPLPDRRKYILERFDGRHSFGAPAPEPVWKDAE